MNKPVAYVNGDELDNLLEDRSAVIWGKPDGWCKTPLYRHPPAVVAASPSDTSQGVSEADELNEAAKDFYNLTIGDARVRIKAFSNESRDAIVKAGERLRAALRSEPTGEQS